MLLTGALLWGIIVRPSAYIDDRCFARFTYEDGSEDQSFSFTGNVAFEFSKNKTGQFNLSGDMYSQGKKYIFSRYVKFNYTNTASNAYNVKILSHESLAHDNVPESLSSFAVKIFFLSGEHTMYMKKQGDSYITIGNTLSPVMNCVIQL
jgi:hypothetical protein